MIKGDDQGALKVHLLQENIITERSKYHTRDAKMAACFSSLGFSKIKSPMRSEVHTIVVSIENA